ncbi:hypothetical protein psal_cds_735 [Pandoravirus salinus]|uniref:Uncharacterized protein n=1 Tax=Pandoravirus salinus TaxID=1349410 RepID=S4VWH3_9VIRU|nr:hypothetical protein psal_cds_735 [Pandoravirus salinus]AGO84718.1 hypothetical protein psal_cds_735 [Pandoravirus salinus]
MKRTQDCDKDDHSMQDDKDDYGAEGFAMASCGRLAKAARVDAAIHGDATRNGRSPAPAPIDILTDDILYHLFNGRRSNGMPIFPPECRWVPALVCRRWRDVIASITRVDAQAASSRLRDALWDGPPSEKMHRHTIVRASGMALIVQHGLSTGFMGAWTAAKLDPVDVAAVLMASAVPDRVAEATLLANQLPKLGDKWSDHLRRPGLWSGPYGPFKKCAHRGYGAHPRHMLVAAAAGSWRDVGALVDMARSHRSCCVATAALHAARRNRVDVVRALLAVIPPDNNYGNMCLINNILHGMWLLVGRHGLLSVGEFLVGLERGWDSVLCFTTAERQELADVRGGSNHDNGWNWLAEAAKHNHTVCLDFCKRYGLNNDVPPIAVGAAALLRRVDFYNRIKSWTQAPLLDAVDGCIHWQEADVHPHALSWIVSQPEFDLFCDYPRNNYCLGELFAYACEKGVGDVEIIRAAAVIAQRWPDVYERLQGLPRIYVNRDGLNVIQVWQAAMDRLTASCGLYDLPPEVRGDIEVLLAAQ